MKKLAQAIATVCATLSLQAVLAVEIAANEDTTSSQSTLLSQAEQAAYQEKVMALKGSERDAYRNKHWEMLKERALKRGYRLPDTPPWAQRQLASTAPAEAPSADNEAIEARKAELQALIEKKKAEAEKRHAEIKSEHDEKVAKLKAEHQARVAEHQAQIDARKAEQAAQKPAAATKAWPKKPSLPTSLNTKPKWNSAMPKRKQKWKSSVQK